jgi:hypothetical protein
LQHALIRRRMISALAASCWAVKGLQGKFNIASGSSSSAKDSSSTDNLSSDALRI